jgi:hypothetical protein
MPTNEEIEEGLSVSNGAPEDGDQPDNGQGQEQELGSATEPAKTAKTRHKKTAAELRASLKSKQLRATAAEFEEKYEVFKEFFNFLVESEWEHKKSLRSSVSFMGKNFRAYFSTKNPGIVNVLEKIQNEEKTKIFANKEKSDAFFALLKSLEKV